MADNATVNSGTGITVATDEVAGAHIQRVKPVWGVDGSAVDTSASNPMPVTATITAGSEIELGATSLAALENISVTVTSGPVVEITNDAGNPIPVNGTVTVNAGTNLNTSLLALDATVLATNALAGAVNESAPGTDTASSGLNGRLQRIAQRLTSLIAVFNIGAGTEAAAVRVTLPTDGTGKVNAAQSGTWNIGTVTTVTGVTNVVHVDDNAGALTVDNGGTFVVQVDGSALTSLQLLDDTVFTDDTSTHSTGTTKGQGMMAVATPTDASVDANDIGMLAMTNARALKNDITTIAGTAPTTVGKLDVKAADGDVFVRQTTAASLNMTEASAASSLTALQLIDDGVFTDDTSTHSTGTSKGYGMMAVANPTDAAVDANDFGHVAMTLARAQKMDITSIAGTGAAVGSGNATGALRVELPTNGTGVVGLIAGTAYAAKVRLTDGTLDSSIVDETGASAVDALAVGGGTPHDAVDSGNPQKIGFKAANALPTAVANNDRANGIGDLWGRQLTSHIDPAMQVHKTFNATSTQTGVDVWSPTSGKKIAVTSVVIGTYGVVGARIILWFGDNADTTYSAGSDQVLLAFSAVPSATVKPGLVFTPAVPVFCVTADRELHITTDAGISIDVQVEGYEW